MMMQQRSSSTHRDVFSEFSRGPFVCAKKKNLLHLLVQARLLVQKQKQSEKFFFPFFSSRHIFSLAWLWFTITKLTDLTGCLLCLCCVCSPSLSSPAGCFFFQEHTFACCALSLFFYLCVCFWSTQGLEREGKSGPHYCCSGAIYLLYNGSALYHQVLIERSRVAHKKGIFKQQNNSFNKCHSHLLAIT